MAYRLNKKSLAVTRILPRGKNANKRLNYVHCGSSGTTVTDGFSIARVSLPGVQQPSNNVLFPKVVIPEIETGLEEMPEGLPAVTSADYMVPNVDAIIPEPNEQTATFTCDAEALLKLLKAALDVLEDSDHLIKLRLCPQRGVLRIDGYAMPGQQSFLGVLKEIDYKGRYIAGDKNLTVLTGTTTPDEKIKKLTLPLKLSAGRKFRS